MTGSEIPTSEKHSALSVTNRFQNTSSRGLIGSGVKLFFRDAFQIEILVCPTIEIEQLFKLLNLKPPPPLPPSRKFPTLYFMYSYISES